MKVIFEWLARWPLPSVGVLLAVWGVISGLLIYRYRKPNIQFRKFTPNGDRDRVVRFLVRNFEPDNLRGLLRLQLKATSSLHTVEVVAGPWFKSAEYLNDKKTEVVITLDGFPAEGVIGVRASPDPGTCKLEPLPPDKDSKLTFIEPRNWRALETPYRPLRAYAVRLAGGFLFSSIMYLIGCAILYRIVPQFFRMPPGLFDAFLIAAMLPLTIASFLLAVPREGKDTFTGAIDWELAAHAKMRPAPPQVKTETEAPANDA